MLRWFDNLSERNRGILLVLMGVILLLFCFGWMREILHSIVVVSGLAFVILGLHKIGVFAKIMALLEKKQ